MEFFFFLIFKELVEKSTHSEGEEGSGGGENNKINK